jgi:hypothetical protein
MRLHFLYKKIVRHGLFAVPPALLVILLVPSIASAHAILVRSDPQKDTVFSRGSIFFIVAHPDDTVPTLNPGANVPGNANLTGLSTVQIDPPALFNLSMITLVELGAIFWVGAQLWINFVLQTSSERHKTERDTNKRTQTRFERRFSLPTLMVVLLANVGLLIGQALHPKVETLERHFPPICCFTWQPVGDLAHSGSWAKGLSL